MSVTQVYGGDIVKFTRRDDGTLEFLSSKATGPDLDVDRQICDPRWLAKAMPEWMETGGNLREMHANIAAGVASELQGTEDGSYFVSGLVVDPTSAKKVEAGVLKGLSIGIKSPKVVKDAAAPGGRIVGGQIVEVSLVDRPANPDCRLVLAKVADGSLEQVEELVEPDDTKRDWTAEQRRDALDAGHALPGKKGGEPRFPIETRGDVRSAVKLARTVQERNHVKRQAKRIGATDLIPDDWKAVDAEVAKLIGAASAADLRKALNPGYATQITAAREAISALLVGEAQDLAAGQDEMYDIDCLLGCLRSLRYFELCEIKEDDMPVSLSALADLAKAATDEERAAFAAAIGIAIGIEAPASDPLDKGAKAEEPADQPQDETPAYLTKFADTLTASITELKEEVAGSTKALGDRLSKVEQMAAPGGPTRTRTPEQLAKASEADRRRGLAEHYRNLASSVTDRTMAQGYLDKAAALDATV